MSVHEYICMCTSVHTLEGHKRMLGVLLSHSADPCEVGSLLRTGALLSQLCCEPANPGHPRPRPFQACVPCAHRTSGVLVGMGSEPPPAPICFVEIGVYSPGASPCLGHPHIGMPWTVRLGSKLSLFAELSCLPESRCY